MSPPLAPSLQGVRRLCALCPPVLLPQLMEAIQKQEEINLRLQDYIDRIVVAIMETNPSILEVK